MHEQSKGSPTRQEIISSLTREEKVRLLSGGDFWHTTAIPEKDIPAIMVADGPHGLRKQSGDEQAGDGDHVGIGESVPATCFPTAATLACSWDRDLLRRVGDAIAKEARAQGVSVVLGPGVNIKRNPLCGRNFEYYSEDPLLAGELAAAFIQGVQANGIGTSLKHFAANNQEYYRMTSDSVVDERTLREIYLRPFEIAVRKAQPWTIMCSYNRINGTYASDNRWLLTTVLRDQWGFQGLVVTDWGAMNDRVQAVVAGCDLEMPSSGGANDRAVLRAVEDGDLDEAAVDRNVDRILRLLEQSGASVGAGSRAGSDTTAGAAHHSSSDPAGYDPDEHHNLARLAAERSIVLLKNEPGRTSADRTSPGQLSSGRPSSSRPSPALLPLSRDTTVAVVGQLARQTRYQGAGSSQIVPTRLENAYQELCSYLGRDVPFAPGYDLNEVSVTQSYIDEAKETAGAADVVLLFVGLPAVFESEGFDRQHLDLPSNQTVLMEAMKEIGTPVVAIMANGAPVSMPWLENVSALLEGYLGGQAGASAIVRALFGEVNPSGKLAETFPEHLLDTPSYRYFATDPRQVEYREALYVGYRYYDTVGKRVLFPFGYGLSYTTFQYGDLRIEGPLLRGAFDEQEQLTVHLRVTNTGERDGDEIVQVYLHDVESTQFRPEHELAGFARISLASGQSSDVAIALGRDAFSQFDMAAKQWILEGGRFELRVGSSSRDIRLRAFVDIESPDTPGLSQDTRRRLAPYYDPPAADFNVHDEAFSALLGRPIPEPEPARPFQINSPLSDFRATAMGRSIVKFVEKGMAKQFGAGDDPALQQMLAHMVDAMPLRSLVLLGGKKFSRSRAEALLHLLNGRPLRGVLRMLRRS